MRVLVAGASDQLAHAIWQSWLEGLMEAVKDWGYR